MAEPFATVDDLAALWRPLEVLEADRAEALLSVASAMVRAEVPGVDARVQAGALDPQIPRWVVCQMAKRVMQSAVDTPPVTQHQESAGAVSMGFTFANPTGDMYLAKAEARALGRTRQVAQTISMVP